MSDTNTSRLEADYPSLEAELQAMRAELDWMRAERVEKAAHQLLADRYRDSQARFRTVFENSPLGHKIIDDQLTIRQANAALAAMLGLASPAELLGRRILEFVHPDHHDDWRELQVRLWSGQLPSFHLDTCLLRPDGTAFWVRVTSVLFADEEGRMGYTTLEDISAQKANEADLRRLYDTQETVLHLIAHDLKSPLVNIKMLVQVLQRDEELLARRPAGDKEARAFLDMIQRSCDEANTLLQDVLYVGELDAKRLVKQPTNLNAFVDKCLQVYRVAAREKGIGLTLALPEQVVTAALHRGKFGRVLDNLLSNALKFTPPGGRITVGLAEHRGRARLTVHDTGVGIPEPLQALVFDKFSTAVRAGLYGATTTGLGLFITKQIVQLHGGNIWLESRENDGTTFTIELA